MAGAVSEPRLSKGYRRDLVKKRKKWTPGEDLELKRYFSIGGCTSAEIAEKLGRGKSAVDARKHKLGLTNTKLSAKDPATVAQILKFRLLGWTQEKIGKVFGVSHAHISGVLCQSGFRHFCNNYPKHKRNKNSWTDIELSLLRKCLAQGKTTVEIQAEELPHRSFDAISRIRSKVKRWVPPGTSTYYRCTRNRYGIPTEVERHIYTHGERGELIGVEKGRVQ